MSSRPWERQSFGPILKGLLNRWQELAEDALFARTARNVDFFGGVLGRRAGTQLVTGWGTYTRAPSSGALCFVEDAGAGPPEGGILVGDVVTFQELGSATTFTRTVLAVNYATHVLTVTPFPPALPIGTTVKVERPIPDSPAIRGLFPCYFRDGIERLIAAAGGKWWRITNSAAPTQVLEEYGTIPIGSWSSNKIFTTPDFFAANGFKVGDLLLIPGGAAGPTDLLAEITFIRRNGGAGGNATLTITIGTNSPTQPTGVTATIVLRAPDPSADEFGVMFANVLNLSSAALPGATVFPPPRKYEEAADRIHRHGIVPPFTPIFFGAAHAGGAAIPGDYAWRFTYRNSLTGQESIDADTFDSAVVPLSEATVAANNSQDIYVWPSLDPQVDKIRIYRAGPGSGGQPGSDYYFVAEIPNIVGAGGGILYNDNMDSLIGNRLLRQRLDYQAPDETEQFIPWVAANRLMAIVQRKAAQPGFIMFSDQPDLVEGYLKGESFPPNNMIFVNHDDGDVYVALSVLFDSVIVFKRRSTWRIIGIPPDIQIQPVHFQANATGVGAVAPKTIVQDHDELLFPHDDGYYQLSRFSGVQSGFVSERLSLPIDNYFLGVNVADRNLAHAHFFRPKRQLRAWIDFNAATLFQFDGPLTGEPMGWCMWDVVRDPLAAVARITASTAMPPFTGVTAGYVADDVPDVISILGTEDGLVLQADMGTADLGCCPFVTDYESVEFAPGGRGTGSRGRALDLRVASYGRGRATTAVPADTTLTVQFITDQLATPGFIEVPVTFPGSPALFDGDVSRFHLLETERPLLSRPGVLVIAPGQWHRLRFLDSAQDTMWRILGWDYWCQSLPITEITRRFRQSTLERLT